MKYADRSGRREEERGEKREHGAHAGRAPGGNRAHSRDDCGDMGPALPVAHLARVEATQILRAYRAPKQRIGGENGNKAGE